jgi:glycosyltransferase involved in cell wall biosynthesis
LNAAKVCAFDMTLQRIESPSTDEKFSIEAGLTEDTRHIPGVRKVTRIAVVNSHPIQYFAPLYAYLNAAPDLEITALYLSDISIRGGKDADFGQDVKWDLDLLQGYRSVFLGEAAHKREPAGFWSLIVPQLWSELRSGRYDVLWLHGHNYAANLLALAAAKSVRLPVMMRGETHLGLPRQGLKAMLHQPLIGALYSLCDRLLAIGSRNSEFYKAMGVPHNKIFLVPYTVDNDRFMRGALSVGKTAEIRDRYHIPHDHTLVLYAAKLVARKRPCDLLEAARRVSKTVANPFTIMMVGSGELEQKLRDFCHEHLLNNVVFTGFVNQSDLVDYYSASDVFVLPSEVEPWGLAVNEAMCAGLPIVASREVGCVPDLVQDGVNGFTLPAGDVEGLARALQLLITDKELRLRQGRASLERMEEWGFRACLHGIRLALGELRSQSRPG